MNYKIAVCDDSGADRDYISSLVRQWGTAKDHTVRISPFPSSESFLFHYTEEKDYDILLLDIEMGEMDGVTMAKELRRDNDTVQIIFITGYSDYIAEGYEVAALHYLTKPVDGDKLFQVLTRAVGRLRRNEPTLTLELPGEVVRVPLSKIRYVDVLHNYVTVHADRDYNLKRPLGELEQELGGQFYRIGRSCVVNLNFVSRVTRTSVELSGGGSLPLPRGQYEGLNRAIIERI